MKEESIISGISNVWLKCPVVSEMGSNGLPSARLLRPHGAFPNLNLMDEDKKEERVWGIRSHGGGWICDENRPALC